LSSILKALKKIEQDESHGGKETHVWPDSIHSAKKLVQRKNRRQRVLISLVTFCCVLAAGIIYTGSKMNFADKTKSTLSPTAKKTAEVSSTEQKKQITEKVSGKIEETNPLLLSKKQSEVALPLIMKTNEAALQKDNSPPASDIESLEPGEPVEPKTDITRQDENLPEIKNDSRLKIQAIAWAEEPSRRFVVINNSIIREGGTIDSITVVSIEDNIIHFNENGNTWRQRFVIR